MEVSNPLELPKLFSAGRPLLAGIETQQCWADNTHHRVPLPCSEKHQRQHERLMCSTEPRAGAITLLRRLVALRWQQLGKDLVLAGRNDANVPCLPPLAPQVKGESHKHAGGKYREKLAGVKGRVDC